MAGRRFEERLVNGVLVKVAPHAEGRLSAWRRHAPCLPQRSGAVSDKLQSLLTTDEIDCPIGQVKVGRIALYQWMVVPASASTGSMGVDVDCHQAALRPDKRCKVTRHAACAGREVEDPVADSWAGVFEKHACEGIGYGTAEIALIDLGRIIFALTHACLPSRFRAS